MTKFINVTYNYLDSQYIYPFLRNYEETNLRVLVPRNGMKITLLAMIPFITRLRANDLHPMI